ncbi:cytochrome c family protein [Falsirhodobacter sp. alg1]|uniref:c-type cytochrome n=1 Tax=Falsirhodobacter sp. alg1 TaxID=1472418 RepID=UPI0005ED7B11|nr:cytochrome c family protein [Falsirhodobacter sp. alg1]
MRCIAFVALFLTAAPAFAGDVAQGQALFRRCMACHSADEGVNKLGPSLHGVFGRTVGAMDGYDASSALQAAGNGGAVWDEDLLSEYIKHPRATFPGTKMLFPGISNADDVADIIAYLKEISPE